MGVKRQRRGTVAADRAAAWLQDGLRSKRWARGSRLPTIVDLAAQCGVSLVTMWKAVRSIAQSGALHIRPRKGVFAGPLGSSVSTDSSPGVDVVTRKLLADCLEGRFHNDTELPQVKELMQVYGCGFRTMKSALTRLVTDGTLRRQNRRYRLPRSRRSPAAGATILLVTGPDLLVHYEQSYYRSTAEFFIRYLEQQCAQRNVRLIRTTVDDPTQTVDLASATDFLGCVVWATTVAGRALSSIVSRMDRLRKPLAVFYHTDEGEGEPVLPMSHARARFLTLGNRQSGQVVANHLLSLGHRRICMIAYKNRPWALERLEGLREAFTRAGYPDGVEWVCAEETPWSNSRALSAGARKAHDDEHRLQEFRTEMLESGIAVPYMNMMVGRIEEISFCRWLHWALEPRLDNCLKDRDITAWVAADDFVGLYGALPYLRSHRIRIPGDISLIGFNDLVESSYHGLSSYHFDMSGMAMRILTFLLYPYRERGLRPQQKMVEVERVGGFIVDRGTIGAIHRSPRVARQ